MKKITLLALCIQAVVAFGQDFKLTWSSEIDNKKKVYINDIIHTDNSGIYYTTVQQKGGMMGAYKPTTFKTVEKISPSFSPLFSKEFTAFTEDYEVENILYAKKQFLIFLSKHEKKKTRQNIL